MANGMALSKHIPLTEYRVAWQGIELSNHEYWIRCSLNNDLQWGIINDWCIELGTYTLYSYSEMVKYVYHEVMSGKQYEELLICLKSFT